MISFRFRMVVFLMLLLCASGAWGGEDDVNRSLIAGESSDTITCKLPDGGTAVLPKHPKRTVVLLTSLLDLWVQAGGTVVGRCDGDMKVPSGAKAAPVVGTFNAPNLEKIILLKPDLVISSDVGSFRAIAPILAQNHIPCAYFSYVNYYDYLGLLELFSKLNGTETWFQESEEKMTREVKRIAAAYAGRPRPRVLVVFATSNSVSCELPNSPTGVMLSLLGAENAVPAAYQRKSQTRVDFSLEHIVQTDPDIVLLNTMGEVEECRDRLRKEFETSAAWSSLRAIRNGRFYVLPKEYFLYKPNDDFPKALQYLAGLLYENGEGK